MIRRFVVVAFAVAGIAASLATVSAQTTEEKPGAVTASPSPVASASPAPSPSPTPPYNRLRWREVGPALPGGRVAAVVGSAKNPKLYYLGAAGGGVWKTVNGGATWSPVFDGVTGVSSIGAIAIDPSNDDNVWVGTGETNPRNDVTYGTGMYHSADGGKTWKHLGLDATMQISAVAVDPRSSSTVVVGALGDFFNDSAERGIYRTTDGGTTWTKTLFVGPQSGVSDLAVDPKNPDVMYAGVWQFRRQPWTFTSGGPDDGIYKSTDAGKTWTKLAGHGLPAGITGRIGIAVAPSAPNRVYALIESKDGILWRSDDAGATWMLMSKDTLVDQRPFYFSHVAVDPSNADHLFGISEELSESRDGGKTFKAIAENVHVDYHAMWIAPNDPQRMITGNDGGYGLTLDGGKAWSFSRNLAIAQVYHVGYDMGTPYRVCAPLQDNNGFCGPSNGLNPQGITNGQWERVVGGDGMWAVPDPLDANLVWTDLQDGNLSIYDRTAKRNTAIPPWRNLSSDDFALYAARYRFNWDSPIAFAPWDGHIGWYGGNVVFQTIDRGAHWKAISPDLTRNDKSHQQPAGGPLALDVSGAEFSDTLLDIEGSPIHRGEIWTGSDDGVISMTIDGGAHWKNVSPPGIPAYGRVFTVAPSPLVDGTAYAIVDRHMSGDLATYAFVTHDHGATWKSIAAGLPAGQEARTIRPDARNPHLVYIGLENSIWASYDDGTTWTAINFNLPPVAIYDMHVQPQWNDLVIATHGRALWILDDLSAVQQLPQARSAGAMLFPIRTTYAFSQHSDDEESYSRYAGKNPPNGAIVSFYQSARGTQSPKAEILDATGRVVRTIAGTQRIDEREVPLITNDAGINRFTWDLREDGPVRWNGAAKDEYQGPRVGANVVPGRYRVRMTIGGITQTQAFEVRPDPRVRYTAADYAATYAFAKKHTDEFSAVDTALNRLDAMIASSKDATVTATAEALRGRLTADYHNDEDSIQRPGQLRENLQRLLFGGGAPPGMATIGVAARVDAQYASVMHDVNAFFASAGKQAAALGTKGP